MSMPRFLLIILSDYASPGMGGGSRAAAHIFGAYQDEAAYVFASRDPQYPVGQWSRRVIGGVPHWCLAVRTLNNLESRPLIPGRVSDFLAVRKHRSAILSLGVRAAMVEAPEILIAVAEWGWEHLCYRFPGTENPLEQSRYPLGHLLSGIFHRQFLRALQRADVVLAAADESAISKVAAKSNGAIPHGRIRSLPTCVDLAKFHPMQKLEARKMLFASGEKRIVLYCGRLNRVKGWDLILNAFQIARARNIADELWIAGDGEDAARFQKTVEELGLSSCVRRFGAVDSDELPVYYNAADLVVSGSIYEGWSQSMLEALACGRPLVSTDVSGARQMIDDGVNGYVVSGRDPGIYADAIAAALALPDVSAHSVRRAAAYDVRGLKQSLDTLWPTMTHRVQSE